MRVQRKFIIGDKWIYFKVYTGIKTADTILIELYDMLQSELDKDKLDSWFFIRFYDPDFHLRIRFCVREKDYLGEIIFLMNRLFLKYLNAKTVWNIQTDTYNRELERYGYHLIDISEKLFHYNSIQIINLIKLEVNLNDENIRWKLGLFLVDWYLTAGGFSLEDKLELFEVLKNNFGKEMNTNSFIKKNISLKFKSNRKDIDDLFNLKVSDSWVISYINFINNSFKSHSSELLMYIKNQTDIVYFKDIVASHIHMTFNRLFKMNNRQAEYVSYEILFLYYRSQIAINKKGKIEF